MRATLVASLLLTFAWACGSSPPAETRVAPAPREPTVAPSPPASSESRGCEVAVRTQVSELGAGRYELVAVAANETDAPIDATLVHACPGPAASFVGLPEGYDVGDRCLAGACVAGPEVRSAFALAPGATREVARVVIDAAASSCNAALAAGSYSVGAEIRLEGVGSCTTSRAVLTIGATPSETRVAPARRPPSHPAPPPERCPAMGCAYTPCPPGVEPPTGCAAVCGCTGARNAPSIFAQPE